MLITALSPVNVLASTALSPVNFPASAEEEMRSDVSGTGTALSATGEDASDVYVDFSDPSSLTSRQEDAALQNGQHEDESPASTVSGLYPSDSESSPSETDSSSYSYLCDPAGTGDLASDCTPEEEADDDDDLVSSGEENLSSENNVCGENTDDNADKNSPDQEDGFVSEDMYAVDSGENEAGDEKAPADIISETDLSAAESSDDTDSSHGEDSAEMDTEQADGDAGSHDASVDIPVSVPAARAVYAASETENDASDEIPGELYEELDHWHFTRVRDCRKITGAETPVFTAMDDQAETAGTVPSLGMVHVLSTEENGWCYVESGMVRGFMKSDTLEDAGILNRIRNEKAMHLAAEHQSTDEVRQIGREAESCLSVSENASFFYRRITSKKTQTEINPAVVISPDNSMKGQELRCGPGMEYVAVGMVPEGGLVYRLDTENPRWTYVESGKLKGFIRSSALTDLTEDAASSAAEQLPQAVLATDNKDALITALYASLVSVEPEITEELSTSSDQVSTLSGISSTSGLPSASDVPAAASPDISSSENTLNAEEKPSESMSSVSEASPAETASETDTPLTGSDDTAASREARIRGQIVTLAASAIGHPYVWGGNDLYNGCDCSGFARELYARVGISLPRTAEAQSQCGTRIAFDRLQPGDLIFYASGGYVHHVAVYAGTDAAGNAQTIEAYGSSEGIIRTHAFGRDEAWACTMF